MQPYHHDPLEREPLDSSARYAYGSSQRRPAPPPHAYSQPASPYYDDNDNDDYAYNAYSAAPASSVPAPPSRSNHPSAHPNSAFNSNANADTNNRMQSRDGYSRSDRSYGGSSSGGGDDDYETSRHHNNPPHYAQDNNRYVQHNQHNQNGYYGGRSRRMNTGEPGYARRLHPTSNITPGADNFSNTASGGMAAIAYNVADRNPRNSGMEALHSAGQVPPPPSRAHAQLSAQPPAQVQHNAYDAYGHNSYGQNTPDQDSHTGLMGLGAPVGPSPSSRGGHSNSDGPYQGLSTQNSANLGVVNPNEIADDGDDGLDYRQSSQRNSMLSLPNSNRGNRQAIGTATAVGAGAAGGGLLHKSYPGGSDHDLGNNGEKASDWLETQNKKKKRWRWVIIIIVFLVIIGAIVGGVVGGLVANNKKKTGGSASGGQSGDSAEDDTKKNGDLGKNSAEIKELMNNPNLHRVFQGMDYTPINSQYPDCIHNPPSQNNITRDVAVLSQLTNKIRLYGTDCNQTEMVLHAIDRLELKDTKVWLGVWQDGNKTTNQRQLDQMWTILDDYGSDPFEGIIVANEILFRKEMTITELGTLLDGVRKNLTAKKIDLPVATSDLGDDWTAALAADSDYIMANIHPFFAGVTAEQAADWTMGFWKNNNGIFWKSDNNKNIISETGWPSAGGKNCGGATTCTTGSVAGIDEMNTFMEDWVCPALANGTNYFWFEAFDEPWKIRFNEPGKEWEDKWGLMTVDRKLKPGIKIPDCGGKTVS